ncbi:12294_t:CDS:2 [Ambispora gerdemannii]|uniref:12294_t:CDS:1 n=1 Tax=Ambispora gerdemannii TaxID=144530 RepID=A0A9N8Z6Y0_9GLOM|nr:12294_t:CDS:2 [Ambispora gerdemannii]
MLKSDPKNVVRDLGNLVDTVFGHPKDNFEKESKNFVKEFEDAPDKFTSGVASLSRNVNGVLDKCECIDLVQNLISTVKNSKPKFEQLKKELDELKKRKSTIIDPFAIDRHDYTKEIEQSKIDYDKVMKHKEQELIKEYRVLMENAMKTVVVVTSGGSINDGGGRDSAGISNSSDFM